jgi:hypothetical protein
MSRARACLLAVSLLSACATQYVSHEEPALLVPDRTAGIALGEAPRAEVRALLGAPVHSSAYWGFDLFRASTEQAATILAITPVPVPFARIKDQVQRYTLVAYDAGDRANAVATGLFRRPAAWRNVSPISSDFPSLHLRAGDVMFFVDPEGARAENLLVAPPARDAFLRHVRTSPERCTAVLGCGGAGCADQLSVGGGPTRRLPLRTAHAYWFRPGERDAWLAGTDSGADDPAMPWLETLVALSLTAGEHVLDFSARHLGGKGAMKFACRPGEVSYLVIHVSAEEGFWRQALVDWRFERREAMPEPFARRALVLVDDGQWQADAEPGP